MSANIFGKRFKFTSFGESHGPGYGVVIDGLPAGVELDFNLLQENLKARKPGGSVYVSARNESDSPEILSGFYQNKSLGTPIAVFVKNENQRSDDYKDLIHNPRVGHADDVWVSKFGHADHRGGGRSSGRETLCRVIAASFAEMMLRKKFPNLEVLAYATQIGPHKLVQSNQLKNSSQTYTLPESVENFLVEAKSKGESYGGIAECLIKNPIKNLGQPVFHKFKSDLAQAMISIGATSGFEFGEQGFQDRPIPGTEFHNSSDSKNYGGIRGGITTGEDIQFRVLFKPTSSIKDVAKKGRHDPCIVPRALPVIKAMAWLVLADHYLWSLTDRV